MANNKNICISFQRDYPLIDLILTFENTLLDLSISRQQRFTKTFGLAPPSALQCLNF